MHWHAGQVSDYYGATATASTNATGEAVAVRVTAWAGSDDDSAVSATSSTSWGCLFLFSQRICLMVDYPDKDVGSWHCESHPYRAVSEHTQLECYCVL